MEEDFFSPQVSSEDEVKVEEGLRPESLAEIIGMEREKGTIKVMIDSALRRDAALDHILFHGPPGLGKTSMAMVIGKEMGIPIHITTGPAITRAGDLAAILTGLQEKSILFIDEIHRLPKAVEEILYPAMEDGVIDIVLGKGPSAKNLRLDLPKFTVVGATTKLAMLSAPLRDRFGVDFRLDFYSDEDLAAIVKQKAQKLRLDITSEAAHAISLHARMTARIAIRILKRVRDLAVVSGHQRLDVEHVHQVLEMLDIDQWGLDTLDRKILLTMYHNFNQRAVGLGTLAASISEDASTLESVYEPFLLRKGLIQRSPRGRVLTQKALDYLASINYHSSNY